MAVSYTVSACGAKVRPSYQYNKAVAKKQEEMVKLYYSLKVVGGLE